MSAKYKVIHVAFGLWALSAVTKISAYNEARNAGVVLGIIVILVAWAAVLVIAKTFDK